MTEKEKKKIILDTNALVFAAQKKKDLIEEIERNMSGEKFKIIIPFPVIKELEKLLTSKKIGIKEKIYARVALLMVENWKKNKKVDIEGKEEKEEIADKWILKNIKKGENFVVITYDRELKKRLKVRGIPLFEIKIE